MVVPHPLCLLIVILLPAAALPAAPEPLLSVDGRRPQEAVVTIGEAWDRSVPLETAMGRSVGGVLAHYDTRTIGPLLGCLTNRTPAAGAAVGGRRVAVIHLWRVDHPVASRVEVLCLLDGSVAAVALPPRRGEALLDSRRFEAIQASWPAFRGGFDPIGDERRGTSLVMERPYVSGSVTLDRRTMSARLYRGMRVAVEDPDRDLSRETLHVRVPSGYDPRTPAGLVVWSSPTPRGRIPSVLGLALDELNMVCVAAENAGNERDVPDKFQLVFDGVATARQRFHVDDRRVYLAGMSGGGKVAALLTMCFSDVFAGAVSIVGFASHSTLDESWAEHRQPYFARPRGHILELTRRHRMALVGGPPDFNYREMVERVRRLEADGFANIRFFEYPDMAHEMPTPARFAEALRWIDEPYRRQRRREVDEAAARLAAYEAGRSDSAPRTKEDRAALNEILRRFPWTEAAWRALGLIRSQESGVRSQRKTSDHQPP